MSANPTSTAAVGSPDANTVPIMNVAVPQPILDTSHQVYEKVVGGLQWYVEQWEDVIIEAKAMLAPGDESLAAADILASLTNAKVASDIPGRVRLRLKQLRGHTDLAEQCEHALGSMHGIRQVEVSSLTGSVLVFYDAAQYASREALLNAMAAL
jgi:hypothetical protein